MDLITLFHWCPPALEFLLQNLTIQDLKDMLIVCKFLRNKVFNYFTEEKIKNKYIRKVLLDDKLFICYNNQIGDLKREFLRSNSKYIIQLHPKKYSFDKTFWINHFRRGFERGHLADSKFKHSFKMIYQNTKSMVIKRTIFIYNIERYYEFRPANWIVLGKAKYYPEMTYEELIKRSSKNKYDALMKFIQYEILNPS